MKANVYNFSQQQLSSPPLLLTQENGMDYSEVQQIDFQLHAGGFSLKYVIGGTENYQVNGIHYAVAPGELLLLHPECRGRGYVDSPLTVRGMCVQLSQETMLEVAQRLSLDKTCKTATALTPCAFPEQKIPAKHSKLGRLMASMAQSIKPGVSGDMVVPPDFFYTLAELYLFEYQQFQAVPAVKTTTRKELYRRLLQGRDFLENAFTGNIEIAQAARQACLSEYQFFRLFKSVFGLSPYQYILNKRLALSREMLLNGHISVSEVALEVGFADVFSFSKAFKKRYGITPSSLSPR